MFDFTGTPTEGQVVDNNGQLFVFAGGKWSPKKAEKAVALVGNTIDLKAGELFTKTISGTTTLEVASPLPSGYVTSFVLELTNGGAAAVTWWPGVKWSKGLPPTLQIAGVDIIGFFSRDGGVTWRGGVMAVDSK